MLQRNFVKMRILVLLVAVLSASRPAVGANPLYISVITSFGQFGFDSSGIIPAIDLALEHINASSDLLSEYELSYLNTVQDSKCDRSTSFERFFSEVNSGPDRIALIGCGCSVATEPVAEISHFWNISQVAPSSASSVLSDRTRFKNFFRTHPTFANIAPGLLSVFQHYGWRDVYFLTQNENLFTNIFSEICKLSESDEVECSFNNMEFETGADPIPGIANSLDTNGDNRIYFLNSYSEPARQIICEAHNRNLTYPRHVWITHGWYPSRWWTQNVTDNTVNCTDKELENFIVQNRVITLSHLTTPGDMNKTTDEEITPNEFQRQYESRAKSENFNINIEADIAYDAIWAVAFALNKTATMINAMDDDEIIEVTGCNMTEGDLVPLHLFNYSNGLLGCVIRWNLQQTNFSGVSGFVAFEENGDRKHRSVRLQQYRKGENDETIHVDYGFTGEESNFTLSYLDRENDSTVYPGGVPADGSPMKVIRPHNISLMATYYAFTTIGIVFAVICIFFNCIFRNRKVIKLTSPNLNYLIVGGALLMYISVYIQLLPTTAPDVVYAKCIAHSWLYFTGYLLAFGATLAKMWRVYYIFRDPVPNKKKMYDWHLVLIALVITGVGFIVLIFRSAFQPTSPQLVEDGEDAEGRTSLGVRVMFCVFRCYALNEGAFYCDIFIFIYLGVLQIVGIILAFQTRNVNITVLNESKFVAALVYFSSIVFVALVIVTFALTSLINVSGGLFSGGILLLATLSVAVTFIPKMVHLYLDPKGDKIFTTTRGTATNAVDSQGGKQSIDMITPSPTENGSGDTLRQRLRLQEEAIKERDRTIIELKKALAPPDEADHTNAPKDEETDV